MPLRAAIAATCIALLCGFGSTANAGSRLLATNGVTQIEGAAGGGLTPWALIAGLDTTGEFGGSAYCTNVDSQDFELRSCGLALGYSDRLEISFARQSFDLGSVVPDTSLRLAVVGLKVRLAGDAIFDANRWMPQLAAGIQYKHTPDFDSVPALLGARDADGLDVYIAATKIYLDAVMGRTALLNATLRATKANQLGLIGFGGDRNDSYSLQPELSAALFLMDGLAVGAEYRFKPDNLNAFAEDDFADAFLAWFPHKSVSLTLAYTDLGSIAGKASQRGMYASIQLSL